MASVLAQRVFSVVTVLILAGSAAAIMMTAGRNAATEAAVLKTIDAQGTRTISVQSTGSLGGLTSTMVDQISRIDQVDSVVGLGSVTDATAAAIPHGTKVGVRVGYGYVAGQPLWPDLKGVNPPTVLASQMSTDLWGLPAGAGSVRVIDGPEYLISGSIAVPEFLAALEPFAVISPPRLTGVDGELIPIPLSSIMILSASPEAVDLVSDLVYELLVDLPQEEVKVSTSAEMAALRAAVGGELTAQGRAVLLGVVAAGTGAVFINVWGFVLMRRKDFGRRRALGATRGRIIGLVLSQVLVTAVSGVIIGLTAGTVKLRLADHPLPPARYMAAVAVILVVAATISATLPAAVAARRDPLRELRVP